MSNPVATVPISVVLPAYNAENFLADALRSVARQTVRPAEVIVVNDASTDGTRAIAMRHGARVIDQLRNAGPSAARNAGVASATSAWVAFLDADDVWSDDKLATQWAALQKWPDAGFCFTDYDVRFADGSELRSETVADIGYRRVRHTARDGAAVYCNSASFALGLVRSMFVRQSSVVINRESFLLAGGYDEQLRLGEDYDLFLRMIGIGPAIGIERPLVLYRRHSASLSADPIAEINSIDHLWSEILARPSRYSANIVAAVAQRRLHTLREGAFLALRLGRFADAAPFIAKAWRLKRSAGTLALHCLWLTLSSPAGRVTHELVRKAWRMRPTRPAISDN